MNTMKTIKSRVFQLAVGCAVALMAPLNSFGADGTWTNLAGGVWGTSGNWLSGTVADGTNAVADFSTLNITANAFVNNDAARTVGTLRFGDTTPGNDWTLTNSTLTLAVSSGTPTITVTNQTATISSILLGTQGFTKNGSGTLQLSGRNTVSGDIIVNQGMLINTFGGLRDTTGSVIVSPGATLYVTSGWGANDGRYEMTNSITLSGTGTGGFGALHGQANFTCTGPITLLTDSKISHDWNNFSLNGKITGTDKNLILSAANAPSQPGLSVNGSMSLGSGALSVIGAGYVMLNASNSFSGGTTVSIGSAGALKIGYINALGTGGLTVNSGVVDLNTKSVSVASFSGAGGIITDTGATGTTTLTVTQAVATTYSGVISNGASRVLALTLQGPGALALSGFNTYSGATAVAAGKLIGVTGGACSNSVVTVANGATNGVWVTAYNGQWRCAGLVHSTGTTTLDIDFSTIPPSGSIAPLRVDGNLTFNGTVGFVIRNGIWINTGTYPLVSYSGTLSGVVPSVATALPPGVTATLVNNTIDKRIELAVTAVPVFVPSSVSAWTNLVSANASGSWGTAANWSNGIPYGVDAVADFTTLNIGANSTITNEVPRSVGALSFCDAVPSSHIWYLDGGTNKHLTLATTASVPQITVSNVQAIVGGLSGTQGFVKNGNGVLALYGKSYSNSITGPIFVNAGLLATVNGQAFQGITGNVFVAPGASFEANCAIDGTTLANNFYLSGMGGTPNGYVGNAATPDGTYNYDPSPFGALELHGNVILSGTIALNADSKITHGYNLATLNGRVAADMPGKNLELAITIDGQYPIYVNGSVGLGTGTLTVNSVQNGGSADGCAVALNAANTYSGGTVLTNYAILRLGNVGALGSGGLTLYPNSKLNLNTYNVTVGGLSGTGGIITDTGAAGTTTLTVTQTVATTYSGVISNGANRVLALVKTGSGLLTLSATNTYTGATTVSNGTLAVSGALSSSGVTVCTGAVFAAGSTGVVARATLGGTLTFQNSSALLVDVAPPLADAVEAAGNVVIGTGVEVRLSGNQEKSGSWEIIKTTGGTVSGDPVLINGLHGARLSRTATAIWLTIPPKGTLIRIF
ncbi:MAG: autotransporter-associated beta strand repeat-containing protein [bacterium]